jgi:hypothetical protein
VDQLRLTTGCLLTQAATFSGSGPTLVVKLVRDADELSIARQLGPNPSRGFLAFGQRDADLGMRAVRVAAIPCLRDPDLADRAGRGFPDPLAVRRAMRAVFQLVRGERRRRWKTAMASGEAQAEREYSKRELGLQPRTS